MFAEGSERRFIVDVEVFAAVSMSTMWCIICTLFERWLGCRWIYLHSFELDRYQT